MSDRPAMTEPLIATDEYNEGEIFLSFFVDEPFRKYFSYSLTPAQLRTLALDASAALRSFCKPYEDAYDKARREVDPTKLI